MVKVLMTGATGFLGNRVLDKLISDSETETIYSVTRKKVNIDSPKVINVVSDIRDIDNINVLDCDVCLHIAGITNNERYSDEDVYSVNAEGTNKVIECCKRNGIEKIIYISSVNVLLEHRCAYAQSKLMAEEMVKKSGLQYIILRPALIYGVGCKSIEMIASYIRKFHIVPVFGKGDAIEQPIFIDEVTDSILYCVKNGTYNSVYSLFGKTPMKYCDMVREIAKALDTSCVIIHIPVKPILWLSKKNILASVRPEQIYHATENLMGEPELSMCNMSDFRQNIEYLKNEKIY